MKVLYARVSSESQCLQRQYDLMQKYNADKMYSEKASGKNMNRTELKKMLEFVREGDVVIVESYSRLARNTADLINIVEQLNKKGVNLVSDKENVDTSTPAGKLIFNIFASLAQFERECLLQRQSEGIEAAKKAGVKFGRRKIAVNSKEFKDVYSIWKAGEITAKEAMKRLNLKSDTFYRRVHEYENEKEETEIQKP